MKLSVILPCYNGARTIAIQLEALTNQTYAGEWELIVVNNGSTDNSMAIVESYRDRLPNLRIVDAYIPPGPRLPVTHSYNVGCRAATGEAFAFCEADDEVTPNWLAAMAAALDRHDFVTGRLELDRLNPSWLASTFGGSYGLVPVSHPPYLPFCSGCNIGMRRVVYETVGELDETISYAWDNDYCWRVQLAGYTLQFEPEALIQYRLRDQFKSLFLQSYRWTRDRWRLHKRYGTKPEKFALLKGIVSLLTYSLPAIKLYPMSLLNIRGGRAGFALWGWGLGSQLGSIKGIFEYFVLDFQDDRTYFLTTPFNEKLVRKLAPKILTYSPILQEPKPRIHC